MGRNHEVSDGEGSRTQTDGNTSNAGEEASDQSYSRSVTKREAERN